MTTPDVQPIELSSYRGDPLDTSVLERLKPSSQVRFLKTQSTFESGPFIEGTVSLRPVKGLKSSVLRISLTCIEQVTDKNAGLCGRQITSRELPCGETHIALPSLKSGFSYNFNFALMVSSIRSTEKCLCAAGRKGLIHTEALPSVGAIFPLSENQFDTSIRYCATATLENGDTLASRFINWVPAESRFDLSQFKDDFGSLSRIHEAGNSLKSGILMPKYHGTLAVSSAPVTHIWPLKPSADDCIGNMNFKVIYFPADGTAVRDSLKVTAVYEIHRVIVAAPEGLQDRLEHESYSTTRLRVTGGHLDLGNSVWKDNCLEVSAIYNVPEPLARTPTYSSCYSYGGYEMKLTVKHSCGKVKLTIPFVVERAFLPGYAERDVLPSYVA